MKLYTEEQVKQMIEKSKETGLIAEYLILTTEPIEVPSDKEIENVATHLEPSVTRRAFQSGAKWMRDKIQGGKIHYLWDKFL